MRSNFRLRKYLCHLSRPLNKVVKVLRHSSRSSDNISCHSFRLSDSSSRRPFRASDKTSRVLTGIVAIFALIALPTFAFAEGENNNEEPQKVSAQLQVSPVSSRVVLKGGEALEYSLTVKSPEETSDPAPYRVYATPYYVTSESYDLSFSQENSHTQISRWIEFKNPDGEWVSEGNYTVNPGEKQTVEYRVVVPDDIPAGGQYATIFVEGISDDAATTGSSAGIKTVSRAGIVIYGTTNGDTHEEATVTDYNFDTFLTGGHLTAEARVANSGNTDFTASYNYTVKNLFGKTLYEDKASKPILPDTTWHMHTEWEESPFMGIFQVSYKVTAPGATQDETKIVLIMPVIVMIITILLLTIIIIWIILFIRKLRARKSRLLVQ